MLWKHWALAWEIMKTQKSWEYTPLISVPKTWMSGKTMKKPTFLPAKPLLKSHLHGPSPMDWSSANPSLWSHGAWDRSPRNLESQHWGTLKNGRFCGEKTKLALKMVWDFGLRFWDFGCSTTISHLSRNHPAIFQGAKLLQLHDNIGILKQLVLMVIQLWKIVVKRCEDMENRPYWSQYPKGHPPYSRLPALSQRSPSSWDQKHGSLQGFKGTENARNPQNKVKLDSH